MHDMQDQQPDQATIDANIEADRKKIPGLLRFAHAAYDSFALKAVSYTIGFVSLNFGAYKGIEHLVDKHHKTEIIIAEQNAAKNNGMVVMCDKRNNESGGRTYMPREGECKTVTLAEAKDAILNPPEEPTTLPLVAFVAVLGACVGAVGARGLYGITNGLAGLGADEYAYRDMQIDRKHRLGL